MPQERDPSADPARPDEAVAAARPLERPLDQPVVARADLVVRERSAAPVPRWRQSVDTVRAGLPALARHPVVRAAAPWAGVGAGLLLGHLTGARRGGGPLQVEGHLRIEVLQHVVHHVVVHGPPELPPGGSSG